MFILIWTPITNPAFLEVFSIWYYSSLSLGIQIRSRFPNDVIFGGTVTSDPPSYIPGHVWATTHRTASSSSELSEGLLKNMAIIRTGIKTNWGRTEFWLGPCFFLQHQTAQLKINTERPGETGPWTSPCLPGGNENKIWSDHSETTAPTKRTKGYGNLQVSAQDQCLPRAWWHVVYLHMQCQDTHLLPKLGLSTFDISYNARKLIKAPNITGCFGSPQKLV